MRKKQQITPWSIYDNFNLDKKFDSNNSSPEPLPIPSSLPESVSECLQTAAHGIARSETTQIGLDTATEKIQQHRQHSKECKKMHMTHELMERYLLLESQVNMTEAQLRKSVDKLTLLAIIKNSLTRVSINDKSFNLPEIKHVPERKKNRRPNCYRQFSQRKKYVDRSLEMMQNPLEISTVHADQLKKQQLSKLSAQLSLKSGYKQLQLRLPEFSQRRKIQEAKKSNTIRAHDFDDEQIYILIEGVKEKQRSVKRIHFKPPDCHHECLEF